MQSVASQSAPTVLPFLAAIVIALLAVGFAVARRASHDGGEPDSAVPRRFPWRRMPPRVHTLVSTLIATFTGAIIAGRYRKDGLDAAATDGAHRPQWLWVLIIIGALAAVVAIVTALRRQDRRD